MSHSDAPQTYQATRAQKLQAIRAAMPNHLKRLKWSRDQVLAFQQKRLRELLVFASNRSSYYRQRLSGIEPETATLKDLENIKPTTKADAMEHWDEIVTVPGLTRVIAENHVRMLREGEQDNAYYNNQLLFFATGGSSGKRGLFIWEPAVFIEGACVTFRCQVADELKHPIPKPHRCVALTASEDLSRCLHASSPLFSINIDPEMEVTLIRASRPIREIAQQVEAIQPTHIIGYSSVIEELSHETIAGRCKINPARVSTNSEPLFDEARHTIRLAWGVEVNNTWGSTESHVAGVENDQHFGMQLAEDVCIIETVDQNLQPVDQTSKIQKLLVTHLGNQAFPIIRYVMDDVVTIMPPNPSVPGYRVLTEIRGRMDDWFIYTDNIKIHPMLFRSVLGQYNHISEYQVKQTDAGANIELMSDSGLFDTNPIKNKLQIALVKSGLSKPILSVKIVDELTRHSETGKVRRFVPLKK